MFGPMKIVLAAALLCLLALPSLAFAPDDRALADQLRKVYGPLSSWEAEMAFPEYPEATVRLWYARGKWRQEWQAGNKAVAVGVNGNVVARCTDREFPSSPMFVWMVPNPVEAWKSWGVDNATRNFGFCDSLPCYLLGAEPGDEATPTVRLNNEDMSPILIRFASGSGLTSVQYSQYRTVGGFRLPSKVLVSFDGDQTLEATVRWIGVNRAEDDMLYAREGLDAAPCDEPPAPFDILREAFTYPQPR